MKASESLSGDRLDGRARNYLLTYSAKRVTFLPRWLPFNHPRTAMTKHTTWDNANYFAQMFADRGAWNVTVTFGGDE